MDPPVKPEDDDTLGIHALLGLILMALGLDLVSRNLAAEVCLSKKVDCGPWSTMTESIVGYMSILGLTDNL